MHQKNRAEGKSENLWGQVDSKIWKNKSTGRFQKSLIPFENSDKLV